MSSDYFDSSLYQLTAGTRARASDVNQIQNALDTGLAKLPSESNLKRGLINYAVDSGAADAYVVTLTYAPTSYTDGMQVIFKASAANTGACTINCNSLGVKSITRQDGSAPVAGDIGANKITEVRYNSTSGKFEIQGSIGAAAGTGTMSQQNANSVAITGGSIDVATLKKGSVDVVTLTGIETLTNKTLTSPKLNEDVAMTVTATVLNQLASATITAFAKTLLDDASADAALTTLGVTAFVKTILDDASADAALTTLGVSAFAKTLLDDADAAASLATLGLTASALEINAACDGSYVPLFLISRPVFTYNGDSTAYTIKVGPGFYYVKDKVAQWTSELTTSAISSPSASTRYYLYLDYSAITSLTAITATELIWSTTAPTYNNSLAGWYNGDDRCIFAAVTDIIPSNINRFKHNGGKLILIETSGEYWVANWAAPSNTPTDVDASGVIPAFSSKIEVFFISKTVDQPGYFLYVRPNTAYFSKIVSYSPASTNDTDCAIATVYTDSGQIFEAYWSGATANTFSALITGWYLPQGM